jgi:hypothetical protein
METMTIVCPNCGTNIDLTKAIQDELMSAIKADALEEAQKTNLLEIEDLRQQLDSNKNQLSEARKNELKLRQRQRDLDEKIENQELEIERRIDEERKQIAKDARDKIEGEYKSKLTEKDIQLERVVAELDAAKKKAEQGSQQLQGEVAELDLEALLRSNFLYDLIEPVGKGIRGADILQRVCTQDGQIRGAILWESKNTKNWNDRWLSKLKEDQMEAKADVAVIVSAAMPPDVENFACVNGVWVTASTYILGLTSILREGLIQVAKARRSVEGKDEKIELLYHYLSGPEFKQRVEMIAETYMMMRRDLDKEKAAIMRSWSRREKSIDNVLKSVSGMYGDLQAIIGALLPSIELLELPESVE